MLNFLSIAASHVKSMLLATALANAQSPATAEAACSTAWERDGDAWHECVCTLETYRCTVQGWCGDPQDPEPPLPDPRLFWRSSDAEGCQ